MYHQYFTTRRITFYISTIWIFSVLAHLPNHIGWGQIRYSFMLRYCAMDTDLFSYAWFYAAALIVAIIVAFVYYLKIYLVLRKSTLSKTMIIGHKQDSSADHASAVSDEIKIIKTSFKIFVLFFISWSPLALLFVIHMGDKVPLYVYLYSALAAHCNSTLNFIMYFIENNQFRKALKELLSNAFNCAPKIHSKTASSIVVG